ncbi:MAG: maleylpyruvate isomerase N-terminal domain-containing protein [Actinobacteria bacterium]|nr:maleylpyruvate isomerase N-terminal domain-containing protein [Actinomycetota bacterium]
MAFDDPCPIPPDRSLAALRMEGDALAGVVAAMTTQDLDRPTRLGDWTVQQLVAHLIRGVDRIPSYLAAGDPPDAGTDWLDYWSQAAETDPGGVAERARQFARAINGRRVLDVWKETLEVAVGEGRAAPADRLVRTPFGGIRLDHYLPTRVLEITVHGLDLRAALGLEEVATPIALGITAEVLDRLIEGPRPDGLADDAVAWVLAATGRAPSDDPRLPVLT